MAQMLQVVLIERRSFFGFSIDGWMKRTRFQSQCRPLGVDLEGEGRKGESDIQSLLGRASAGN